jgi:hypothetical protein
MKCDAACCKDKKDDALPKYEGLIREEMSENELLLNINSYLSTFGLNGHLLFHGHRSIWSEMWIWNTY